jgi:hypothetical protein
MHKENVIGNKYGRLTVIEEITPTKSYKRRIVCICECGKTVTVELYNAKSGHTSSCGCLGDENRKNGRTTHGMSKTREYKSYCKMIERCYDPGDISYHNYGGRGIYVCDRWRESFENFIADMGLKPTPSHSIERKETNGIKKTQQQWAEALGVRYTRIIFHMNRGVSFAQIVEYVQAHGPNRLQFREPARMYWPRKHK